MSPAAAGTAPCEEFLQLGRTASAARSCARSRGRAERRGDFSRRCAPGRRWPSKGSATAVCLGSESILRRDCLVAGGARCRDRAAADAAAAQHRAPMAVAVRGRRRPPRVSSGFPAGFRRAPGCGGSRVHDESGIALFGGDRQTGAAGPILGFSAHKQAARRPRSMANGCRRSRNRRGRGSGIVR